MEQTRSVAMENSVESAIFALVVTTSGSYPGVAIRVRRCLRSDGPTRLKVERGLRIELRLRRCKGRVLTARRTPHSFAFSGTLFAQGPGLFPG